MGPRFAEHLMQPARFVGVGVHVVPLKRMPPTIQNGRPKLSKEVPAELHARNVAARIGDQEVHRPG